MSVPSIPTGMTVPSYPPITPGPKEESEEAILAHPVDFFSVGIPTHSEVKAAGGPAPADPTADAQEIPGLFKVLRKGDKVWFSIPQDQLKQPFFFSCNVSKSIGENGLTGSEMGKSQLAEFRVTGNQVQLVAKNTAFFAEPGTPQSQFVSEDFADSLIASAPVVPGQRSNGEVVVEANALLFTDIPNYQTRLTRTYDTPFALDPKNTSFADVENTAEQTSFGVQAHYAAQPVPPKGGSLPSTSPDGRSVLTEFRYSFAKLPDEPMKPRLADDRIGHFVTTRKDYNGDSGDGKVRMVNRWRLEKKDPNAEVSEPVQPITYWIAKDVPEKYRPAVAEGILEWNKAFEKIGFHNAVQVRQQTDNDNFDTMDARHASIRWYTAADVGAAVGPSQVDPRSGEILDADVRMADIFARSAHKFIADNPPEPKAHVHDENTCTFLHDSADEQRFAQDLLEARGDNVAGEALAQAYVKDVVMHEVGHTLGLRHNFKGSLANSPERLQDAEYTKVHGLGNSVMDYQPFNLAGPGEKQGEYIQSTLGAYDYLAIKYAYSPLAPTREKETLAEIAAQTTKDPALAYETDEGADSLDPLVNRFDLGSDPLAFAQKQVTLGRELWRRAQERTLPEGTPYQEQTRAFVNGLNKLAGAGQYMARYIGGVSVHRDHAGTDKATFEPVPAEKQRQALQSVVDTFFQPDSFRFKPDFLAHLAKDRFETWGDQDFHAGAAIVRTQSMVLNTLLQNDVAQRLIDSPEKMDPSQPVFTLGELYEGLQNAVWSELPKGAEIPQMRRDLQRAYLKAIAPLLDKASPAPGDATSLMRYEATQLKTQIDEAAKKKASLETRAHLAQCSQILGHALNPD